MDREQLIESVAEDLFAYVMRGNIAEKQILPRLKPAGLDDRFEDFDALVDLHFLLRPDVVEFVDQLPQRLRSIKTQTRNERQTSRGEIPGQIKWDSTIKTRSSKAPGDHSLFVCSNRHESYDIDENIVLKRLLSVIYNSLEDCEKYLRSEPEWMTTRWQDNLELVDQLRDIFERNVHVARIREPETYEPTERMMETAEHARNDIYREAETLLRKHQKSRAGDHEAIRDLLNETLITPDKEEVLFELYVLFRYVRAIENHQNGQTSVSTIESGKQEVARIESAVGKDVVLYHDNSAHKDLDFVAEPLEKADADLTRTEKIKRESRSLAQQYFNDYDYDEHHSDRPDIIVLEIQDEDGWKYLITEVKYSQRPEYILDGVEETLEYLAFLRKDNTLVFDDDSPFGSGWNGVLVVQDIEDYETMLPANQNTIRILQASELDDFIPTVVEHVL